jgi:hypothetical protein
MQRAGQLSPARRTYDKLEHCNEYFHDCRSQDDPRTSWLDPKLHLSPGLAKEFVMLGRGLLLAVRVGALIAIAIGLLTRARAEPTTDSPSSTTDVPADFESPWLVLPTFSSNPKLGTSLGAMGGYLRKFDPESQLSIFGLMGQYTSTDSVIGSAVARTSFGADHHRLTVLVGYGKVKNDYEDYLGTGVPLKSEDNIRAILARYLYRAVGDWFIGPQFVRTNYQIVGQTGLDQDFLTILGLTGFESGGLGLVVYRDSRDVQDSPKHGWVLNLNNVAYRERIAGDNNFDVYRLDYKQFWSHGNGNVFAIRQSNQWTVNAPAAAYAPVLLRGYTMGEYLGQNMSSVEVEERYRLGTRWTATFFGGIACLYGAQLKCFSNETSYPSLGLGLQYLLKPNQGLVANLEYAQGKDGNDAVIFKMGYGF